MIIKNCRIIYENRIETGSVQIRDGKITAINPENFSTEEIIDANGLYLSPGFIDIHIHGAGGSDTMDGSFEAINNIAKTIVKFGTTSFLPTTMTCDTEAIKKAASAVSLAKVKGTDGAQVLGLHLEGPFINSVMTGAQDSNFIQVPSIEAFKTIVGESLKDVITVTLAPEIAGAIELIKYLKSIGIVASIGHSNATYEETSEGFKNGITHSTHLFNVMTGFHHREPGVVGAIFDSDITTETICDGVHIAYPALRVAYKVKSMDKVIFVTDAMMACGMEDGLYSLGGQEVLVKDGSARLKNGALAGSILTVDKAIRNVFKNTNYPLYEIVKAATYNPAKHCKVAHKKGLIKEAYDADLVLFDEDIKVQMVMVNGKLLYNEKKLRT